MLQVGSISYQKSCAGACALKGEPRVEFHQRVVDDINMQIAELFPDNVQANLFDPYFIPVGRKMQAKNCHAGHRSAQAEYKTKSGATVSHRYEEDSELGTFGELTIKREFEGCRIVLECKSIDNKVTPPTIKLLLTDSDEEAGMCLTFPNRLAIPRLEIVGGLTTERYQTIEALLGMQHCTWDRIIPGDVAQSRFISLQLKSLLPTGNQDPIILGT